MAESGDLITSKINGIRYIEKPPLPYWIVAGMYRIFGQNTFATHLPNALAVLGLAWLAWLWARRAWGDRAAFYAGLGVLTSVGCFLFTRFIIPEAILAFFLLLALYALITTLEDNLPLLIYWAWASGGWRCSPRDSSRPYSSLARPFRICCSLGNGGAGRRSSPSRGCVFLLMRRLALLCGIVNRNQGHPVGDCPPGVPGCD